MTRRPPHPEVETIASATRWVRGAWQTLPPVPVRLHDRDIEDGSQLGAHRFSAAMWRILVGSPDDVEVIRETDTCYHPRLGDRDDVGGCDGCFGTGVKEYERTRYRSPMSAALRRLSKMPPPHPDRASSLDVVVAYAWSGYDIDLTASRLGMPIVSADHRKTVEALVLLSLRRLHSVFSSGPIPRTSWVDKSESQRNAEDAA